MRYIDSVDPFLGNGEIDLPSPSFPASTWHFIKGLTGNTNAAAALPFGKYSCLAYDGAYPTGYGVNDINSGEPIRKIYEKPMFIGLSHFQQSGTGAIGVYYNYALTVPYCGEKPEFAPREMIRDEAHPGYYCAEIREAVCEATVSDRIAAHRYHFKEENGKIAIDFANDGLYASRNRMRGKASGKVKVLSETEVLACMELSGLTLWFDVVSENAAVSVLFRGEEQFAAVGCCRQPGHPADEEPGACRQPGYPADEEPGACRQSGCHADAAGAELELSEPSDSVRFGVIFAAQQDCSLRIAVSANSPEHARELNAAEQRSFDEIRQDAEKRWESALSKVEIETEDVREREIFYSNLYHTLIKPCDYTGEAFLFEDHSGEMVTDIATMWDIYKTQLPFLFTLFPEISRKFLKTLERFGEANAHYPHCLLLSGNTGIESQQARMLAEYSIFDAYVRGIEGDYEKLLDLAKQDGERFPEFLEGKCKFASHTLDIAEAYAAMEQLARRLGRKEDAEAFAEYRTHLADAFDADGMMRADSDYYEGNRYNYSFRPLYDMEQRFAFAGERGKEILEKEALRFFGYEQSEDVNSRFEGFNNETDMEAPYFLHGLGRRDLLCEVIRSGMDSMFATGYGGIPGNADSGGLTACYLWNVLGIFPLTGQDRMIVGTPRYKKAVLHLPKGDFEIRREGEGIYVKEAWLNGRKLEDFTFAASEMMEGGVLVTVHDSRPERAAE